MAPGFYGLSFLLFIEATKLNRLDAIRLARIAMTLQHEENQ
jgi:hypothetical protein